MEVENDYIWKVASIFSFHDCGRTGKIQVSAYSTPFDTWCVSLPILRTSQVRFILLQKKASSILVLWYG